MGGRFDVGLEVTCGLWRWLANEVEESGLLSTGISGNNRPCEGTTQGCCSTEHSISGKRQAKGPIETAMATRVICSDSFVAGNGINLHAEECFHSPRGYMDQVHPE